VEDATWQAAVAIDYKSVSKEEKIKLRSALLKELSEMMDDVEKAQSPVLRAWQIERYLIRMVRIFTSSDEQWPDSLTVSVPTCL